MSAQSQRIQETFQRLTSEYGMLGVLLILCVLFSVLTVTEQNPDGREAASNLIEEQRNTLLSPNAILVVVGERSSDALFTDELTRLLHDFDAAFITISGDPQSIRKRLASVAGSLTAPAVILTTSANVQVVSAVKSQISRLETVDILVPTPRRWPTFLLADNIRNVANQITVIAIIAIGMTIVILTAGIDLSVGSLIAFCAVITAWLIHQWGAESASTAVLLVAGLAGIGLTGMIGAFSGMMITKFRIPPFIATLAMMQVAAGLAYIVSKGMPIYQVPDSFIWLGRGVDPIFGIPIAVILMLLLYIGAHVLMSRTTLGRYIYAVGGNPEAARLAGVKVNRVLLFAYIVSALLAGLGGVLMASQLKSGAPTYGLTYELYVIAAVVVGGTSLSGGEGKILGTLIGALIIGVIQNGMNLINVESYTQKVVLGLVILGAVLLDRLKHTRFRFRKATAN